jgi:protein TonB
MDVTDVLRDRMHEPGGLGRMAAVSTLAHATAVALIVLSPGVWPSSSRLENRNVMTINLMGGGPRGADTGGFTPAPGRAIQEVAATKEPPRAPAAKPEMTLPVPGKPPSKVTPSAKKAPDDAKGQTRSRGAELSAGAAVAETGIRGQGFGLSTSSSGGAGGGVQLDVANFCCWDYISTMTQLIREAWARDAEVTGQVIIKFTIERSGVIRDATVQKSSGYLTLDNNALRAVRTVRRLSPLPVEFTNSTLGVQLTFEYQGR